MNLQRPGAPVLLNFWREGLRLLLCAAAFAGIARACAAQEDIHASALKAIQPSIPANASASSETSQVDVYGDPLPRGAVARLGTTRYRHPGWYKRIAFMPDNETFLVGTADNTVRQWEARSGRLVRVITLGDARLAAFRLSRDGSLLAVLASLYDRQAHEYQMLLKVWEIPAWKERAAFGWNDPLLESSVQVALAPDGALAATGTRNGKLRMWDLASGQELLSYQLLEGEVESIDFSPTHDVVAVASRHGVAIWQWLTENPPHRLEGLPRGGQVVTFSPDGTLLAVGESRGSAAKLFAVPSGDSVRTMLGTGQSYYREGLEFTADGQRLIVPASNDRVVEVFSVPTGKVVRTLDAGGVEPRGAAVSGDGKLLAVIGSPAEIKVWDLTTGKLLSDNVVGHAETPYEIIFLPGSRQIATGSVDGTIRIWDRSSGVQQRVMGHQGWVAALVASANGQRLLSCGLDDTLRLWGAATGEEIYQLPGHGRTGGNRFTAVAFADGERTLRSFGSDLYLRSFDAATGKATAEFGIRPSSLNLEETPEGGVRPASGDAFGGGGGPEDLIFMLGSAYFTADGSHLFLGTPPNTIHVFDAATGKEAAIINTEVPLNEYALSVDASLLATMESLPAQIQNAPPESQTSKLTVRRYPGQELVWESEIAGRGSGEMCFSPDGKLLAVCLHGESPVAKQANWIGVYATDSGREVYRIEESPHNSNNVAFAPDGLHLAASYRDSSVLVWSLKEFRVDGRRSD